MGLFDTVLRDLDNAFKEGREIERETLRLLKSVLHNRQIEKRSHQQPESLTDEEVLECIRREIKKRKEAVALYTQGGKPERATQENQESVILERYLPPQMSEDEITHHVRAQIKNMDTAIPLQFGKVMKEVMILLKGKADAQSIQRIVQEELARVSS